MEVWLDLEQTIISTWEDPIICNRDKVRAFLESAQVSMVNVFSFAVWNEQDQRTFRDRFRPWLEQEFGVVFNACPCLDDLVRDIFWKTEHLSIDRSEIINIFGKAITFEKFIRVTRKSGTFVLIDDMVEDTVINRTLFNGHTQTIELINVDNL